MPEGEPEEESADMVAKSLVVTGGATGIGLGIANAAVADGYRVGLIDVDPSVSDVEGATGYVASVTNADEIEAVLDDFGTPDVWVNNAGIVRFGSLLGLDLDDWRAVLDVNLTGVFIAARAVARRMGDNGSGAIINITSMNGVAPGPNAGAYGATKAAVALLTQQMALEWGGDGIRVNAVAPGLVDAGMSSPLYEDDATRQARESKVPVGRLGTASDVAEAVLFLADERSSYITGQNLLVDGGVTMAMIANLPRPKSVDGVGHD